MSDVSDLTPQLLREIRDAVRENGDRLDRHDNRLEQLTELAVRHDGRLERLEVALTGLTEQVSMLSTAVTAGFTGRSRTEQRVDALEARLDAIEAQLA